MSIQEACSIPKPAPRWGALPLALAVALLGWADAAPAQDMAPSAPMVTVASAEDPDLDRARELEAKAASHQERVAEWSRAGDLYREAAAFRPAHDPAKVEGLRMAARMTHYAGDTRRALEDARRAAEVAKRQGNVRAAAEASLEAAWLAAEAGDADQTARYLDDARVLARSPYLSDEERQHILGRISEPA